MNTTLEELKNVKSDCCITILLQTHRTLPENEKDPIVLKNLIKEAEQRLKERFSSEFVERMIQKLNQLAESINHRHNKEGLALFVNENLAKYVRLPLNVENRIIIDKTFATRDLVRAGHRQTGYYVLLLSRDKARLIEAFNDKVVEEVNTGFPLLNPDINELKRPEASFGNRRTNLAKEFFNQVGKQLNEIQKQNLMPVIIITDESNYSDFLKVTDKKERIVAKLFGNRMNEKPHSIVEAAWPVMQKWVKDRNNERLQELKKAVNSRNVLTDFNEIWNAVNNGRGKTLFVKQGYFQPARLQNNHIELLPPDQSENADIDDVIDEMIEINLHHEGDSVFIEGNELEKFNGLALITKN